MLVITINPEAASSASSELDETLTSIDVGPTKVELGVGVDVNVRVGVIVGVWEGVGVMEAV